MHPPTPPQPPPQKKPPTPPNPPSQTNPNSCVSLFLVKTITCNRCVEKLPYMTLVFNGFYFTRNFMLLFNSITPHFYN